MIQTSNFTVGEKIDLTNEIALVQPLDTPLFTYLMTRKAYDKANSTIVTWREKTLDTTEDISAPEGSETNVFYKSDRVEKNNVCEIFKKAAQISGTAEAINIKGIGDLYASEMADRLAEIKVNIEKKLINGVRDDGSTSGIRKMAGLLSFVLTENKVSNSAFDEAQFKATVKKLWDNGLGSNQYIALVNADIKEMIDDFYKNSTRYIGNVNEYGVVVDKVNTNYGVVNLVLNRHVPAGKMIVFDPAYIRLAFLRTPANEILAKTGDYIGGQVIVELTLKVLNAKALALFELTA